jgi:hypothetical protein
MPTIQLDTKIHDAIAQHGYVKIILSLLLSALTFGRARGWFTKANGPQA